MTSYHPNVSIARRRAQMRHLITFFGQDLIYFIRSIIELAVNSAVSYNNEGTCGVSNVLSYFKISNGYYTEKGSIKRNKITVLEKWLMDVKISESRKTRRKKLEL